MLTPPPSSARTELAMRIGDFGLNSPVAERAGGGRGERPPASDKSTRGGSAFSAQNRAILLSGLPQSPMSKESPPQSQSQSPSPGQPQRRSLPQPPNRRLTPLVTVNPPSNLQQHPQYRQHYYAPQSAVGIHPPYSPLQSPRTLSPCVNVKAVHLAHRRHSSNASSSAAPSIKNEGGATSDAGLTPPPEGRLLVSAYIIPDNEDRKPFLLRREFDLQELLDAVPRQPSDRRRLSSVSILASPIVGPPRSPLSALPSSANTASAPAAPPPTPVTAGGGNGPNYTTGMKRPASDHSPHTPASPHPNLRRQAAGKHNRQPSQKDLAPPDQFQADGGVLIPLRPHPSLGGLPALAAIILSRRVAAGDVVELPLPHPDFWPQTASYIYRNRGELTDEVRQNIEHLGGKCE